MDAKNDIEQIHTSVLLRETMHYLSPRTGGIYVDGTLGLGGHTAALLERSAPDGRVIAFEWDQAAIELAKVRLQQYGERLVVIRRNFAEIGNGLKDQGIDAVDGLLVDIGLSSLQLDQGGRGFSFRQDEPLDMRMDTRKATTATSIINGSSEEELADIFYYFGDEKQARPIAREIVRERKLGKITTSKQLATIVARAVPKRFHPKKIHVATKVFQAVRIAVNRELENLATFLDDSIAYLNPGAPVCVISFHSLEDRLVKRRFKADKRLEIKTKRPVMPSVAEQKLNSRARSARLRVAVRKEQECRGVL